MGNAGDSAVSSASATAPSTSATTADSGRAPDESNTATEIVRGKVEHVDVSRHPEPTIPDSDLSLADIERSKSHPVQWAVFAILLLLAIIVPYGIGRDIAVRDTADLVAAVSKLSMQGVMFVSWLVTVLAFTGLGMLIVDSRRWLWRVVFVLGIIAEQLIAGMCLLRFNFWYSTYVVYGSDAPLANAANLGIMAAGVAVAVYALVFVGLLVAIRKDSPLNALTHSWASLTMFFVIEVAALCIVMFGGLLEAV
ncbi:MAG: hypothetical protein ACI38B_03330 [Bifidobacterium sp.]|uniref:hypothetical protein n=1 Tax=Bifidobacterium sp. TaxID=41200 RepID=UPI003F05CA1B